MKNTNRSLTVVTAFFDLGKFPKGSFSNMRTPDSYNKWMGVYDYLIFEKATSALLKNK
jgi:hypothetical protein